MPRIVVTTAGGSACSTCGVTSFARGSKDGKPMVAINARCLDGVDPKALDVMEFDGASR